MLGTNAFAAKNINFNKIQETSPHTHTYIDTNLHSCMFCQQFRKCRSYPFSFSVALHSPTFAIVFCRNCQCCQGKRKRERERGIGRRKEMGRAPAALLGPIVLCNICFVFLRNYKNDSRQCSKKYTRSQDKPNAIRAKKKQCKTKANQTELPIKPNSNRFW